MQDLFETPELLPLEVQAILERYDFGNGIGYDGCAALVIELEAIGYTCDYQLDAVPIELHRICTRSTDTSKYVAQLNKAFEGRWEMTFHDASEDNDETDKIETEWMGVILHIFLPNPTNEDYPDFVIKVNECVNHGDQYLSDRQTGSETFATIKEVIEQINLYTISH